MHFLKVPGELCPLTPQGNALFGFQLVLAWVLRRSNFGPSADRLWVSEWASKCANEWQWVSEVCLNHEHWMVLMEGIKNKLDSWTRLGRTRGYPWIRESILAVKMSFSAFLASSEAILASPLKWTRTCKSRLDLQVPVNNTTGRIITVQQHWNSHSNHLTDNLSPWDRQYNFEVCPGALSMTTSSKGHAGLRQSSKDCTE